MWESGNKTQNATTELSMQKRCMLSVVNCKFVQSFINTPITPMLLESLACVTLSQVKNMLAPSPQLLLKSYPEGICHHKCLIHLPPLSLQLWKNPYILALKENGDFEGLSLIRTKWKTPMENPKPLVSAVRLACGWRQRSWHTDRARSDWRDTGKLQTQQAVEHRHGISQIAYTSQANSSKMNIEQDTTGTLW